MTGQQLRNSILQEAIYGRLVPNVLQPGEKTGGDLLKDILAERQKKENEEKGKKAKKLTLSTIEEDPWELPEGWCWTRLGDIVDYRGGLWEGKKPPFVRVGVIRNANFTKKFTLSFDNVAYLNVEEKQYLSRKLEFGDIIIEKSGGGENQPVGRPVLFLKTEGDFSFSNFTQMIRIADKESVLPSFLQQVLVAFYVSGVTLNLQSNTTNLRNLDFKGYLDLLVPLPPLSIQKAIVEKIEDLLPLIDEYDKAAVELETLNKILPDKLRKSVLQEAIHGTLVPNDIPEGEATGAELLQQILKERQEKENKEKGKKAKKLTLSEIEDDVEELPYGWCWCKLSDIGDCLYGVSESAKTTGPYKLLRITDIQNDSVNWDSVPLSDYKKKDVAKYYLTENDLVFARTGGTVGKSYLIQDVPNNSIYASYLIRVRFQGKALLPKYIKYFFQSPQYWSQIIENAEGTGQPNCNGTKLANLNIPLPPLSIQHRIVEKIEEVFSAINKLQA